MHIVRAKDLISLYQLDLRQTSDHCFDLLTLEGRYIDTLYYSQIGEMQEEDFIAYYLDEGIPPDSDNFYYDEYL